MSFIAWLKKHVCEDDAWITVHPNASGPGSPVLLDDEGYIKGGMGGKFTGQRIDLMPRKSGYGVPVSENDPLNKATPGFLRTSRYTLKAPSNLPANQPKNVASQVTQNTPANATIQTNSKSSFQRVETRASKHLSFLNVDYNEVKTLASKPTDDEIVRNLSGGDRTSGSCASLALAFIGQKDELDVGDFRGGASCLFFQSDTNIKNLFRDCGANVIEENSSKTDLSNAKKLLRQMQDGKSYYYAVGEHVAVARRNGKNYEYLELQSPTDSGWKRMDNSYGLDYVLINRFGCTSSSRNAGECYMVDISEVKGDGFRTALGYINTSGVNQKRGASGSVR